MAVCDKCGNVHEDVTHDLMCKQLQELKRIAHAQEKRAGIVRTG